MKILQLIMEFDEDIQKFNFNNIDNYKSSLIIGHDYLKRQRIVDKLINNNKNKHIYVISDFEESRLYYETKYQNVKFYNGYNKDVIEGILFRAVEMIEIAKKYRKKFIDIIVIMDILEVTIDITIHNLFMNHRFYMINLIISSPIPLKLMSSITRNIDFIFLLSDNSLPSQVKICENYDFIFPSINYFIKKFNEIIKFYGCMVIKNYGNVCIYGV